MKNCGNCRYGSHMLSNYPDKVLCINDKVPAMKGRHHQLNNHCLAHTTATPEEQNAATDQCIQGYVDKGAVIRK